MEHEEIVAWVKAHGEVLSANLEMIGRYPVPFRKVIVGMMSGENRLAVWREHLTTIAASDSALNAEQNAFVLDCAATLHEVFSSKSTFDDWESRSAELFTREQRRRIFETLGPPEPPGGLPLPLDAKPTAPA